MGRLSVIALAGTKHDLAIAIQFPPEVQWDKIIKVEIPGDHGDFPDTSGYEAEDFGDMESKVEDSQLLRYMQTCVDGVLDFVGKNSDRLARLNFQNIESTVAGMNTGGSMFVLAGVVSYEPMLQGRDILRAMN